jgi:hypothetical protein
MPIAWLCGSQQSVVIRPSNAINSDEKLDTDDIGCVLYSGLQFGDAVNGTYSTETESNNTAYLHSQCTNCSLLLVKVSVTSA